MRHAFLHYFALGYRVSAFVADGTHDAAYLLTRSRVTAMRLDRIVLREIRLELKEPFRISSGEWRERRIFLLELFDASGASVWSECVAAEAPNYSSETIDTAWMMIGQWVAPRVFGRDFAHPREVHDMLDRDFRGHNMAKAAVEMGLWALAATMLGEPLARFIGGTRTEIATGISLGIQKSPAVLIEKARAALDAGYRKVKIKIEPGRDVEWIAAARDALGPDAHLMADANNAYTLDDMDRLVALDGVGLMMIEQPLAHDDIVRHATLQKRLRTPICLDESITSLEKAQDMVVLGSGRIVNIKAGRVGGFHAIHRDSRFLPGERRPRLVRRHARERCGPRIPRGDCIAPELHPTGRRQPERPLLGA